MDMPGIRQDLFQRHDRLRQHGDRSKQVIDIEQRDEIRLDRIFLSLMDQRKRRLFHAQMDVICAIVRVSLHAIGHGTHRAGIDDLATIWVIDVDDR